MNAEAWAAVIGLTLWVSLFGYVLTGLREEDGLPNALVPPVTGERRSVLAAARRLGDRIMSALDDALARFTAFVKDVIDQLKGASSTNETQTGKIAELQAALDAALSDDAADKAAIAALQAEIASLQDSVAAQINSAIDALSNPLPAVDPAPPADTPDITVPGIDGSGDAPVQ